MREEIEETIVLRFLENWDLEKLLCWDKQYGFEGNSQTGPSMSTVICAKLRNGKKKNNNKCCGREEEEEESVMIKVEFVADVCLFLDVLVSSGVFVYL